jgi:hypothetical protein
MDASTLVESVEQMPCGLTGIWDGGNAVFASVPPDAFAEKRDRDYGHQLGAQLIELLRSKSFPHDARVLLADGIEKNRRPSRLARRNALHYFVANVLNRCSAVTWEGNPSQRFPLAHGLAFIAIVVQVLDGCDRTAREPVLNLPLGITEAFTQLHAWRSLSKVEFGELYRAAESLPTKKGLQQWARMIVFLADTEITWEVRSKPRKGYK